MPPLISKREISHHTPEQVTGYITDALGIVTELEVDGQLGDALVLKIVDLLAAKQIFFEQSAVSSPLMAIPKG